MPVPPTLMLGAQGGGHTHATSAARLVCPVNPETAVLEGDVLAAPEAHCRRRGRRAGRAGEAAETQAGRLRHARAVAGPAAGFWPPQAAVSGGHACRRVQAWRPALFEPTVRGGSGGAPAPPETAMFPRKSQPLNRVFLPDVICSNKAAEPRLTGGLASVGQAAGPDQSGGTAASAAPTRLHRRALAHCRAVDDANVVGCQRAVVLRSEGRARASHMQAAATEQNSCLPSLGQQGSTGPSSWRTCG